MKIIASANSNTVSSLMDAPITMKIQKDNGFIDKLNADKAIGETLCDIYVKPMLKEKDKEK